MRSNKLFWIVDVQHDFMDRDGKLYVEGAEDIKGNLSKVKSLIDKHNINTVHTMDWHYYDSAELSETPDFINTFPEHCMAGTRGADIIPEIKPNDPLIINWDQRLDMNYADELIFFSDNKFEFLLRKDMFDFIEGNSNSAILTELLKERFYDIYVVGVAGNVCVNFAVKNLLKENFNVKVITDCIKDLPNIPSCEKEWLDEGAEIISLEDLEKLLVGSE